MSEATLKLIRMTPAGRGAIATLRVEGPGAAEAVSAVFHGRRGLDWRDPGGAVLAVGRIGSPEGEVVVVRRCGNDAMEIHCHGGSAAVAAIEAALAPHGGQPVTWSEWASTHHADPIAAAARIALAEAPTERTALVLLDQFHGALRRQLQAIRRAVERGETGEAIARLDGLLARVPLGLHLTNPWRVVLAGLPNVGKSSLINALLGYQRAIVHPLPGTTRDLVTGRTAVEGWPIELCDTAGLRQSAHPLESAGVELARRQIAEADLVLLVGDLSRPWSAGEESLLGELPHALVVHNKADLPADSGKRPRGLITSATSGQGLERLLGEIAGRLVPEPPPESASVPFTREQASHLREAKEELLRGNPGGAALHLGRM